MIDLIVSFMLGQFLWHLVGIVQFLQSSFVCTEINTFGIICGLMCSLSFNVFSKLSPNDSSFIHMPILKCFIFFYAVAESKFAAQPKIKTLQNLYPILWWNKCGSADKKNCMFSPWRIYAGGYKQFCLVPKPLFCFTWYVHSGGKGKSVILHRFSSRALACL